MFFSPKKKKDYLYLLEKHLEPDEYIICSSATREHKIENFEQEIGYRLPDEFRDFTMSNLGGLYVAVKEEIWPRTYGGGPAWIFAYGITVFGLASGMPDWQNIRKLTEEFRKETKTNYTPFMTVISDADVYCFDKDSKIYQFHHEGYEFEEVNKSFIELLDFELRELADRNVMIKEYKKK